MSSEWAQYFDGDRPVPQSVVPEIAGEALEFVTEGGETCRWPVGEVRRVRDPATPDSIVLRWSGDPLARLIPQNAALLGHLPHLGRKNPPQGRGRLIAWAAAAVTAVALQIGVLIPLLADNLATFIPPEGERALGEATFGQIRSALDDTGLAPVAVCARRSGTDALDRLLGRLGQDRDDGQQTQVFVLDHEMINAFALPGGYVVLFRGLIEAAQGPDEVAAVLAHEIGHVVSRDPTRHALRSAGSIGVLGLLLGDFAGGAAVLFLTERLISAQYSQAAETGADAFAHKMLQDAGITPAALGTMFETMRAKHGDREGIGAHFLSHPRLGDRIEAAHEATDPSARYTPSMPERDWQALREICR